MIEHDFIMVNLINNMTAWCDGGYNVSKLAWKRALNFYMTHILFLILPWSLVISEMFVREGGDIH
jgi:hypothetical protein